LTRTSRLSRRGNRRIHSSDTTLIKSQPLVVDLAGEIMRRELGLRPIELDAPGPEE
jgi:hypothetical protein